MDAQGRMQIDTYWSRINLEQDRATGLIRGEPEIEPWLPKAERPERQSLREDALPAPGLQVPASLQDASHPGHRQFLLARCGQQMLGQPLRAAALASVGRMARPGREQHIGPAHQRIAMLVGISE